MAVVKKTDKKWIVIFLVLLSFCTFYVLKINGHFDYSAKYDIEYIQCAEGINRLFLIDGDNKTTWGIVDDKHVKGENIDFKFKRQRSFSKIVIFNNSEKETVPVNIYVSNDGMNFELYPIVMQHDENEDIYSFETPCNGEYLRIENRNLEEQGQWPITEVKIYE